MTEDHKIALTKIRAKQLVRNTIFGITALREYTYELEADQKTLLAIVGELEIELEDERRSCA